MENNKHQLERYQKILMYLAFVFMLIELTSMMLWAFQVVVFPLFLVFVPQVITNILGTIALWKRVTKQARIALIMTIPVTVVCAVILQLII